MRWTKVRQREVFALDPPVGLVCRLSNGNFLAYVRHGLNFYRLGAFESEFDAIDASQKVARWARESFDSGVAPV